MSLSVAELFNYDDFFSPWIRSFAEVRGLRVSEETIIVTHTSLVSKLTDISHVIPPEEMHALFIKAATHFMDNENKKASLIALLAHFKDLRERWISENVKTKALPAASLNQTLEAALRDMTLEKVTFCKLIGLLKKGYPAYIPKPTKTGTGKRVHPVGTILLSSEVPDIDPASISANENDIEVAKGAIRNRIPVAQAVAEHFPAIPKLPTKSRFSSLSSLIGGVYA